MHFNPALKHTRLPECALRDYTPLWHRLRHPVVRDLSPSTRDLSHKIPLAANFVCRSRSAGASVDCSLAAIARHVAGRHHCLDRAACLQT